VWKPGKTLLHEGPIAAVGGVLVVARRVVMAIALGFAVLGTAVPALAAVERPQYTAGDRWVYDLVGSLAGLPGLNASAQGDFALRLAARVEVSVVGPVVQNVGGTEVAGIEVATHTSGFLNGTFVIPNGSASQTVTVTGSLTSDVTEVWEVNGYFPIESEESTAYAASISFFITVPVEVHIWTNATTNVTADALFPLDVGGRASASLKTDLAVNLSAEAFGSQTTFANETTVASTWSRLVLAQEPVAVEAGTFQAYRLNQTLGSFPVFAGVAAAPGANETAFWSNDVGYYVKRTAYVNGSEVAEMQLKSYSRGPPGGFSLLEVVVGSVAAAVAASLTIFWLRRRRKAKAAAKPPGVEEVGDRAR